MPRKKAAKYKCDTCGKAFAMPMHLGRHMTTVHGQAPKSGKRAKPRKAARAGTRRGRRLGRPRGVVGRLGLRSMSLDQLVEVISAAKEEANRRIDEIQQSLR